MPDTIIDYHAQEAAYRRRLEEALPATKATIFKALAAADISHVVVTFDGSGDDGRIESVTAVGPDDTARELPAVDVEVAIPEFWIEATQSRRAPLAEAIDTLTWALLECTHGGFENDEGGYGEITFDTSEGSITLEMNVRRIESDHHEHRF